MSARKKSWEVAKLPFLIMKNRSSSKKWSKGAFQWGRGDGLWIAAKRDIKPK